MSSDPDLQSGKAHNYVAATVPETVKARVEIEEFLGDNDMTNLFLIALSEIQKEDPGKKTEKNSQDWWTFYSLSSIHGLPQELWDNVQNLNEHNEEGGASKGVGYCTHGSTVFPTWHRVYILMFEQAVANKMREVAGFYEDDEQRQRYLNAAARFRLPFWDPLMPRNKLDKTKKLETMFGIPEILRVKEVFVKHWDKDGPAKIDNPLEKFSFPNETTLKAKGRITWTKDDWMKWIELEDKTRVQRPRVTPNGRSRTLRTPGLDMETNYYEPDLESKDGRREGLNLKIQRQAQEMGAKLWKLLSSYEWGESDMRNPKKYQKSWGDEAHKNKNRSWDAFANHLINQQPWTHQESAISLESWHDAIHVIVGSGRYSGHMGDTGIAAFDPIFWLHHCNIDRILAIYQALYPAESEIPNEPSDPSKWIPEQGTVNSKTPLYPFRKNAQEFWTSQDVQDWTTLGFAVPGNKKLDKSGRDQLETYLRENYYWVTEFDKPPASVSSKWPKCLKHSFALRGYEAEDDQPGIQFEALEQSKLVNRFVEVAVPKTPKHVDKERAVTFVDASENKKLYPDGSLQGGKNHKAMRTWTAQVLVKKFAFNGSFSVHIFIGDIKKDQAQRFFTKKNEVGYSGIFASDSNASCANCVQQREDNVMYQDGIPLTMAMTKYLTSYTDPDGPAPDMRTLQSLEPEHVVPFLKQHLNWIITDTASEVKDDINAMRESRLEISVWDRIFDLPTPEHRLGLYHPAALHQEITQTHPGGLGYSYT